MKRKNWTHSEKFKIVLEGLQGHRSVAEICNDCTIHQRQYDKWRETFLRETFLRDTVFDIEKLILDA